MRMIMHNMVQLKAYRSARHGSWPRFVTSTVSDRNPPILQWPPR